MERTYINEAQKAIGGTVKVQGFIENLRNSKYMAFIVLKDITGKLQITVEKEDHPDLVDTIDQLTPDSVITVTGKVVENDYVKMGGVEMIPESIEVESTANALPIVRKEIAATKKKKAVERSSIDQRIDYRWIDLRTDETKEQLFVHNIENLLSSEGNKWKASNIKAASPKEKTHSETGS